MPANSFASADLALPAVSGYTFVAIRNIESGNTYMAIEGFTIVNDKLRVRIHNLQSVERVGDISATLLYAKSNYIA